MARWPGAAPKSQITWRRGLQIALHEQLLQTVFTLGCQRDGSGWRACDGQTFSVHQSRVIELLGRNRERDAFAAFTQDNFHV